MKIKYLLDHLRGPDGETIAVFGAARLLKYLAAKFNCSAARPTTVAPLVSGV